jgi:CheY-like chemotaxis protein
MLLEAEGFDVIGEAQDGQSALSAVEELHPDVVLLDVQLPDIDGIEVAARLTANGSGPAIAHIEPRPCGPRPGARPLRCARLHSKG